MILENDFLPQLEQARIATTGADLFSLWDQICKRREANRMPLHHFEELRDIVLPKLSQLEKIKVEVNKR